MQSEDTRAQVPATRKHATRLSVALARCASEVREAQRLRFRIFGEEFGAQLPGADAGIDCDAFDPYCDHLVARDEASGDIVGTYRILPPERAAEIGSYYTETEFEIARLAHLRPRMVEVGRSCVHPDYRSGGVIMTLWAGLARYMLEGGHEYLVGCASIALHDGGHAAASVFRQLERHLAPLEYRVFPRCRLPLEALAPAAAPVPPLLRGYLRAGAWICGEPAWDPDFNSADLPVLLPMSRVRPHYARHFFGEAA